MMSKFKQLRLRLVVAVAVLLMAGMGTEAFAQCYTKNLQQAESLYKQGRYAEAKKRFAAAKACPDKPKTNNLDSRIAACNRKIKERRIYQQNFTLYSGSGNVSDGTLKVDGKTSVSTNFSSSGGTERFTVSGVSSWDTWGIPSWCSVENRTSTSFTLRCEANNSSSSRSDYMKITSGSQEVRIDITQDASASRFSGNVENVWVDYDQWQNGKKGMLIHVKFTVDGMKGREGKCVAYFKYEGGDFLKDYNNDYGTTGGQVCCPDSFTPNYDSTRFSDFRLFMPYDELHMAKGKYDLAFHILIYDQDTQEDIVRSSDQNFTFTQN